MIPFVNIHSHNSEIQKNVISVYNVRLGVEQIPQLQYLSVGIHPWDIESKEQVDLLIIELRNILQTQSILAIGECGLDKLSVVDFTMQLYAFEQQVLLAEEFQKPIIIHCVKAYNEVISVCKRIKKVVPIIFHKYTGSEQLTKDLLQFNVYFSIQNILKKQTQFIPINRLFIESDDSKEDIKALYKNIAIQFDISVEELKDKLWSNWRMFA